MVGTQSILLLVYLDACCYTFVEHRQGRGMVVFGVCQNLRSRVKVFIIERCVVCSNLDGNQPLPFGPPSIYWLSEAQIRRRAEPISNSVLVADRKAVEATDRPTDRRQRGITRSDVGRE